MPKMSKEKGSSKQSRLRRYAKAPMRILCRARDLYVQSLTSCAGNMRYGGYGEAMRFPTATMSSSNLPRSFSVVSSSRSSMGEDDDFRDLMRVASMKALQNKLGTESPQQQLRSAVTPKGMGIMPRSVSHSVAIVRIDEDEPCDFAEEDITTNLNATNFLYPRSRSCAAVTKRPGLSH